MAKFEMYKDASGQFRFRLKAGNGQNILSSEAYTSKAECENGIESVKKNSSDDARFERLEGKSGKPYFNLKSTNGQVIGTSQQYASTSSMEAGIASVMNNASGADVEDMS
ncbi:YegP family protein [Winogradskyella maritima]|uniref:YegP family protein n=1 Tax=Winogradskyella maritima TaxID=1517766 RepID=A0ABV8AJ90_9FLAO|nr:YegP family protein [Winogradskyella maritima]